MRAAGAHLLPSAREALRAIKESIDMKVFPRAGILAATRLTRAGRLADATAFIQRMLQHRPDAPAAGAPPPAGAGITIDGTAEEVRTDAAPREPWQPHVDRGTADRW
jgi:hypothetical protein